MTGEAENSQLLGVARVDVLVNTDQWTAAIQQGETRLSRMTESAQQEYAKLDKTEKRRVDTLLKQLDAIGKTREQQLLANAAYNGLTKYPALFEELRGRAAAAAVATKDNADSAKALGDALKGVTFTDVQLFKGNQALADFKRRSDEARQAQAALAAAAEETARRTADAQLKAATLSPSQLFRGNQGLNEFQAQAEARRQLETVQANADAADQARLREVIRTSLERVDAEQRVIASQQRSVEMTDAQRAAVERIKASQQSQADISARGQRILDAEARSRVQAANGAQGESEALRKLLGQIDPVTAAYERLDRMEDQLRKHRQSGALSKDDYDTYAAKVDAARKAVGGADEALHHFSLTSGVARREIGTLIGELARGDISNFEGSLITLANNTGLLASLLSPAALGVGAVTAALGALVVAAADAYEQEQRLNEAIAISGNFAGVTAGSFDKMASGIAGTSGHLGEARDVLNSLVASGRVGADSLEAVGQAGYDIAILTKKGAEEAAQAATQMFDGTVASLLKANEQYHFLSEATYERVKALEEEGRQQDAVRVAAEAFHDEVGPRIEQMKDQVYGLARAWQEAKQGTAEWYETFRNGASLLLGTASLDNQIAALQGKKDAAQNHEYSLIGKARNLFFGSGLVDRASSSFEQWTPEQERDLQDKLAQRNKIVEQAEADSRQRADAAASISADQRIDRMSDQVDKAHQLAAAVKALNADYETLWSKSSDNPRLAGVQRIVNMDGSVDFAGGQYDVLRKDLEKKYADNSGSKLANADAAAQLSAFKATLGQFADAYANAQRELDAQRKSGSISEADYYERSRAEIWKTEQAQVDAIQQEIALLQARKVTGADAYRNQAQITDLTVQLHKAEADAQSKVNVLNEQEAAAKAKATAAINAYIDALGQQTAARQAEIDLQVAAVGMGDKEFAQLQRLNKIRQDAADQQLKLTRQLNTIGDGGIDQATYLRKTDELRKATDDRIQAELDGQDRLNQAQSDWTNGLSRALDQYRDQASNVAGASESAFSGLFDGIEQGALKGSTSLHNLAETFLTDLLRIELRIQESKALQGIFGGLGGGSPIFGAGENQSLLQQSIADSVAGYKGNISFNAKGNAFDSPDLSRYRNGVYDSPHMFAFAKGAGVFGEAGPEAIMPLTRTADGHLGVRTAGSAAPSVEVHVTNNAPVQVTTQASQTSNGMPRLDLLVEPLEEALAARVDNGKSKFARSLSRRTGTSMANTL